MRLSFPPLPVGSSIIAGSLQGISQIRGILIDNPSGQWLFVTPTYDYVPPYTNGWTRDLSGGVVSINVKPGNGPAGQVSTIQGDPVLVTLDSEPVGNSQGATSGDSFIQQFTPLITNTFTFLMQVNTDNTAIIITGQPGKRIRLRTLDVVLQSQTGFPPAHWGSGGIYWVTDDLTTGIYVKGRVGWANPESHREYPNGLDFTVGSDVTFTPFATYAGGIVDVTASYEFI